MLPVGLFLFPRGLLNNHYSLDPEAEERPGPDSRRKVQYIVLVFPLFLFYFPCETIWTSKVRGPSLCPTSSEVGEFPRSASSSCSSCRPVVVCCCCCCYCYCCCCCCFFIVLIICAMCNVISHVKYVCTFMLVLYEVCVQGTRCCFLLFLDFVLSWYVNE